jgi:L-2,4-diaminobutyrate decarboxylase
MLPWMARDPDFRPAREELRWALETLADALEADGEPVPGQAGTEDALAGLPDTLPETGVGGRAALEALAGPWLGGATRLGHPGFFAHMDPPAPWPAWAAAMWAAALNQNLLHVDTAPVARDLEQRVVGWLAPAFGMDGGHLVPGSTLATLTALWAARELRGAEVVLASEVAHLSARKAAAILGLRFEALPVDERQRLRADALEGRNLERAALVLTAGTVTAGAIDPLTAGEGAAWRHVDAAWGGPLRLSRRHAHRLDGVERADSVGFSAHKWLYQPKESAAVLFADAEAAQSALSYGDPYLAVPNVGVLGSHGASASLALAATLLAWGRTGLARRIEHAMELAIGLARRVQSEPTLELWGPLDAGIVLWRPHDTDLQALRERLQGAMVSLGRIGDDLWLRSVPANPDADVGRVVDAVLAAARS